MKCLHDWFCKCKEHISNVDILQKEINEIRVTSKIKHEYTQKLILDILKEDSEE